MSGQRAPGRPGADGGTGAWARLARARVSRRRALAGGAAGAAALALAACDGGSSRRPLDADATPRRGGTLRTGTALPLSYGLDPQVEIATGLTIFPRVYGYLLHVDPRDETLAYDHTASLEQPDDTTFIFHLKPGIRFHNLAPVDGRDVEAEDVVFSVLRYRDNPLVANKTWYTGILDRVEAPDAATLRVTTRRPNVYSLSELGGIGSGAILPREAAGGGIDLVTGGVGSGPFVIDRASIAEDVRLVRHSGYYAAPLPHLDAMEWTIFRSDEEKMAAFEAQRIDVMPNRDRVEAQQAREFAGEIDVTSEPSLSYLSLGLRVDRPPFNDPRVREAADMAIDRDALIRDVAFGEGDVPGPVNPHLAGGYWSLSPDEIADAQGGRGPIEERRVRAKAIIEDAGAAGAAVPLQTPDLPPLLDVATVVRDHLRRVGLAAELVALPLLQWFVNLRRGAFEATLISHLPYESPDLPARFYHSGGIDGSGNLFGFSDPAIDLLVERSWGEGDRATRRQTLLEAQRLMVRARPMLQLLTSRGYTSAWRYVRNRRPELPGSLAQYNYEQWLAER